jgi:hypothetical protein
MPHRETPESLPACESDRTAAGNRFFVFCVPSAALPDLQPENKPPARQTRGPRLSNFTRKMNTTAVSIFRFYMCQALLAIFFL